jgi:hypothetical protein
MGIWEHHFASDDEPRKAIRQAAHLGREIEHFEAKWPEVRTEDPIPTFSWQHLERQLVDLSASKQQAAMVGPLISATRKLAQFKPPEMVLREILCLTWVLMDENFRPGQLPLDEAEA